METTNTMDHGRVDARPRLATIVVIYNGIEKALEYNSTLPVRVILEHAIREFGISQNQHLMSLFNQSGVELTADLTKNQSAEDAGIRPCEKLLLRPSVVRGGMRQ